jgi:hypothetical protein
MTDTKQLAKLEFVAFCIEQYKKTTNQNGFETEQLFEKNGIINFLIEHYEVLHTQSPQQILNEIMDFLNKHQQ